MLGGQKVSFVSPFKEKLNCPGMKDSFSIDDYNCPSPYKPVVSCLEGKHLSRTHMLKAADETAIANCGVNVHM